MRKELVCFVPTTEDGIESSVRLLKQDKRFLLIEHEGHKFAVPLTTMIDAIYELKTFNKYETKKDESEESKTEPECPVIVNNMEIEYGENGN